MLTRRRFRAPRPISPATLRHARESRHTPTEAEIRVWAHLRAHRLGPHFRRQHPIGDRYIVDFACAEARLCIEIDGESHSEPVQAKHDAARTAWLVRRGYRVIRFTNDEVRLNLEGVLDEIRAVYLERMGLDPVEA